MSASSKKYVKAVLNLILAVVIVLVAVYVLPKAIVFFMPFVIGYIIAWIAGPVVHFLEKKIKIRRKMGSAVTIILVIGLVVFLSYVLGVQLIRMLIGFIRDLPAMWQGLENDIKQIGERFSDIFIKFPKEVQDVINGIATNTSELAAETIGKISSPTINAVGNFAKRLPAIIIGLVMCLLSSYFFVAGRNEFSEKLRNAIPEGIWKRLQMIKRSVSKAVGGYFKAQCKIEVWIYLLLVIGLFILKVEYTPLIAFGIAIMDFLPFLGTGTILIPWAIVKLLNSEYQVAIGLLIIWGVTQIVRQIIQPKYVGESAGIAPLPTLFLLYIGYKMGSVIGMIVAVPLGIILLTMYQEGVFNTTKYSIQILIAGFNKFRKLTPQDKAVIYSREKGREQEQEHDAKF